MKDFEWFGEEVLNAAKLVLKKTSKEVANDVMNDAKTILSKKAETTTERGLLSQFDIKPSKYDEGTYIIWCQGPGNWHPPYHASFVEMGYFSSIWGKYKINTSPVHVAAKPFMRPANKMNKRPANLKYQAALDKL